jgi:cytochrome c2
MHLVKLIGALVLVTVVGAGIVLVSSLGDETSPVVEVPGGSAAAGKAAIERLGCTSCHRIPGLREPEARVGPPLDDMAERRYIAGDEPNTLSVMLRWLQDPQAVEPGTLMPDLGVTEREARDIAAYLYSDP